VQSHPDAHLSIRERALGLRGRRRCVHRARESDEERVALRIDLDAAVAGEGSAQDAAMLRQHLGIVLAELVQQPGRPLDIREEEGDGARR
jgi:hypothetical protein